MSREVNVYTKGGGGSIGLVPGVVPAAWGGPGRARGAVRAVPKTEDFARTRVNLYLGGMSNKSHGDSLDFDIYIKHRKA